MSLSDADGKRRLIGVEGTTVATGCFRCLIRTFDRIMRLGGRLVIPQLMQHVTTGMGVWAAMVEHFVEEAQKGNVHC
jgi:hypothetical protein